MPTPVSQTLPNGLQVITVESHSSPTVAVNVAYHVGSRNDPPGRSGFAHLFEHMMFKSTTNLRAEQFDRLTEDVGGYNNANTADDYTHYFEVVPSNYLETLLWVESEEGKGSAFHIELVAKFEQLERAVRDTVGITPDRRAEETPNRDITFKVVAA